MLRKLFPVCLGAALCTVAALTPARLDSQTSSGPSAWVYVSSLIGTTQKTDVYGFVAGSSGKLTPISGSPFPADLDGMAVNGVYLFGAPATGTMIDTYRIQSNGSLTYAATVNAAGPNKCSNSAPFFVTLDHTGATLYDLYEWGDMTCSNNAYQAWNITKSSGALTYDGTAGTSQEIAGLPSFIGNNVFAYTSSCYHFQPMISGFKRNSNGSLTQLSLAQVMPKAASGQGWCPYLAAADPTNHLAIPMQPYAGYGDPVGPYQLASYTVNTSTGALSTSNTYANMPKVAVGGVRAVSMSPSGKLLAVAGTAGLQVFHFNGAYPVTAYTG
ncbi:hypothetical protein [Occallatibacter riparius]|uniref:Uncharacterized protein n=1 Tax=Occallatibacter riparius TaxID=1002689 RepID=A0A9J7BTB3_9BACT|nr:hypothetical protein [Occallatibacter riparius]UWZ85888.1 hypothetical protein MOP44_08080 [Occallatibacter riparius]